MPKKISVPPTVMALLISIVIFAFMISTPSIGIDELLSAPEQIEIDGRRYNLESFLWRDFMPISPPDGKNLIASVQITAADKLEFPSSIYPDRLWVIKGRGEIWETPFTNERPAPLHNYQLEIIARGGPKWGPNIQVDIVVKIIHGWNTYLLKASNQTIHATY